MFICSYSGCHSVIMVVDSNCILYYTGDTCTCAHPVPLITKDSVLEQVEPEGRGRPANPGLLGKRLLERKMGGDDVFVHV